MSSTERGNAVYLVAGADGAMHPVKDHKVMAAWAGSTTVAGWPIDPAEAVTLVTVVRRGLEVAATFVMRLDLRNRRVSQEGAARAMRDADLAARRPGDKAALKALADHLRGLPPDWRTQLAVYLDVPCRDVDEVRVGGPLALARQTRMSVDEVIEHILGAG